MLGKEKLPKPVRSGPLTSRSPQCEGANKMENKRVVKSVKSNYEALHKSIPLFYSHSSHKVWDI